jgi:uncharacterized protein YlxW (UPF0749 family)
VGEEQVSGRARLWRALVRPDRSQAVVGVLLALVGFAAITQIRATEDDSSYASLREQDLIDVLNGLAGASQRTQAEIDRLVRSRDDLQSESTRRQAAIERARRELDSLTVLAGRVPVSGPGVRVTLSEVTSPIKVSTFLDVIQELRSVGAEAIQVNGEVRLVADSAFEDAEGGLLVDGVLLEPPFVIDAIGDPSALRGAMVFPSTTTAIEDDGGRIETEEESEIDIDSVAEPRTSEFAEPAG